MKRWRVTKKPEVITGICSNCGSEVLDCDIAMSGYFIGVGYRNLCSLCYAVNAEASAALIRFEPHKFDPVQVIDCQGVPHDFRLRMNCFGPGVALNAYEIVEGFLRGYQFQIIGDPEEDPMVLLGRLVEKMRRALAVKHLVAGECGVRIANHGVVRGLIKWDGCEEGVPYLNVDGQEVTWDELGRMLLTYEGWQFKLEIRDKSEEV